MLASRFNREVLSRVRTINGTWPDRLQGTPNHWVIEGLWKSGLVLALMKLKGSDQKSIKRDAGKKVRKL